MKYERKASIPCLVVPPVLRFSDSASGHKQIITIYNPLSYSLTFKVLATKPGSYQVIPSTGKLNAQSSIDVVIKLNVSGDEVSKKHKFLVRVSNSKMCVAGDQVVAVEYRERTTKAQLEAFAKRQFEAASNGNGKNRANPRIRGRWSVYPFLFGMLVVALLASYETSALDATSKMFISYIIGIVVAGTCLGENGGV
mmetsp:Transcript_6469/g.8920  ORF Transcript_6469/g.8920 Transcript_6469/m.8920 type:complete len:196 (+) Transcript_6469:44-631(+)|eukprot:CAMPEP_0184487372 /NCGR_PEP_ID=MMETSP0113_2-20130426/9939_1 /TAXON_ID=91329 /ORGANISM="Norrisiella sphaerica, Strain BC52" /LENGTH=195 /DNA_ID=CAMNT_0026869659 /DNA_START=44 /DNA_END=631 /DNA_ORIENTATION=+